MVTYDSSSGAVCYVNNSSVGTTSAFQDQQQAGHPVSYF